MELIEIFTRYIFGTDVFDKLVKENAGFFTKNRRSWTQQETAKRIKEIITSNFSEYTDGTTDEQITIKEIFTDIPYFGVACAIYPELYNRTLIYRTGQGDLVIDVNAELDADYDNTETEFYENNLLNYK